MGLHPPLRSSARMAELDLLRFLAALAVVFYHLTYTTGIGWLTRHGYLGVDLFFMISGFVILWSAQGATAREFLVSRFARLYPALWLCMAITIAAVWLLNGVTFSPAQILANATMVGGYLGQEYIDVVYWTLAVELKFYVLVLGLILLRQIERVEWWAYGWLAACMADAAIGLPGAVRSLIIAPYGVFFIAGMLFYLVRSQGPTPERIAALLVCCAMAAAHAIPNSADYLHGERSWLAAPLVVALFGLMAAVAMGWFRVKGGATLASLSALTYPLYLLHNAIGKAISEHSGPAVAVAAALVLAYAANAIDRPVARAVKARLTTKPPVTSGEYAG